MEENNSKGIKKKILISLLCGMLIGCGATTGFFKYQQSKNPVQGGQPPKGEMIPQGMTKEEFEAEMKNKKENTDDSSNLSNNQNSTESTTDDSTKNESAE